MAENSIIGHIFLYFKDVFDFFEVRTDLIYESIEVFLRSQEDTLSLTVPLPDLFNVVGEFPNELLNFLLPLTFHGFFVSGSAH